MRPTLPLSPRPLVIAPLLGALLLTGCGEDSGSHSAAPAPSASSPAGPVAPPSAVHNDVDVDFVRDMIPHHEGAVTMADLVPSRAASAEVKALAGRIKAAQDPEIVAMRGLLTAWGRTLEPAQGEGDDHGHESEGEEGHGADGAGHDGAADVAALTPLTGEAFDREWLRRMIAHHEGAIPMSERVVAQGQSPQAQAIAQSIIAVQRREIDVMTKLLAAL